MTAARCKYVTSPDAPTAVVACEGKMFLKLNTDPRLTPVDEIHLILPSWIMHVRSCMICNDNRQISWYENGSRCTLAAIKDPPQASATGNVRDLSAGQRRCGLSRNARWVFFLTLLQSISALAGTAFSLLFTLAGKHTLSAVCGKRVSVVVRTGHFLFVIDPIIYMMFLPNLRQQY
ncbi:hypothetical protein RvY_19095 [Ramazzottius varieornatus]|uniref:Uncharacterized protein n=1 Tax=Ramazzottius varieornatus TaxID=947166 RepID=A0A1D1W879_RAMVA|nr:hypothetical protein RvY_19095 [Ramazzottius varieornatus]